MNTWNPRSRTKPSRLSERIRPPTPSSASRTITGTAASERCFAAASPDTPAPTMMAPLVATLSDNPDVSRAHIVVRTRLGVRYGDNQGVTNADIGLKWLINIKTISRWMSAQAIKEAEIYVTCEHCVSFVAVRP